MTESPTPLSCTLDEYTDAIFRSDSERASFFDDTSISSSFLAKPDIFADYDDWTPRIDEQFLVTVDDALDTQPMRDAPTPALLANQMFMYSETAASPMTSSSLSLSRSVETENESPKTWRKSMMFALRARKKHRSPEHVESPTILRPLHTAGGGEITKRRPENRGASRGKKGNRLLKKLRTPSDIARAIHQNEVNASLLTQTKNRDDQTTDVKFINPLFALSKDRKSLVNKDTRTSSIPGTTITSTTTTTTATATTPSTSASISTTAVTAPTTSTSALMSIPLVHTAQPILLPSTTLVGNNATPSYPSSPASSSSPVQERRQQDTRVPANPLFRKFIPPGGSYEAAGQVQPTRTRSSASASPRTLAPVQSTPASSSFPALQRILERKPSKDKPKKVKLPKPPLESPNRDCSREWRSVDEL